MEIQGGLTMSKPAQFGQRAALAGTRVGQKLSHLTTRRVIIGKLCCLLVLIKGMCMMPMHACVSGHMN